jgi:SAM-dependent methyltransferase
METLRSPGQPRMMRLTLGQVIRPRLACYPRLRELFSGIGLEVGGPSHFFTGRGLFPVYPRAQRLDNCNFAGETIWEGKIAAGETFRYHWRHKPGRQYFSEATDLGFAADDAYDFLLSSHMLEHSANPIRALMEWKRVIKPDGGLLLVLPHRDGTFDRRRPVTPLQHLIEDFEQGMGEEDLSHVPEILELHDYTLDPGGDEPTAFAARCRDNFKNRSLHQHVFDTRLAVELVDLLQFQVLAVETAPPYHIAIAAVRKAVDQPVDNERFLRTSTAHRYSIAFPSDLR